MPDFPLPGYPQPFGSRMINVTQHAGPANYQQGNASDVVTAHALGWSVIDKVDGGATAIDNANNAVGTYTLAAQYPFSQASLKATGANTVNFQWKYAANGNEVANGTNLSGEYARIVYFGDL